MLIIVSLILLGIILMLVEMLLVPGVGIAGIAALVSLAGACWYAFTNVNTGTGIVVTSIVVVLLLIMLFIILRAKTWKKFALKDEITSKVNTEPDTVQPGDTGITVTRLAPMGTARVEGKVCEAKSEDNSMIDPGTEVIVTGVEDNKIIVKIK